MRKVFVLSVMAGMLGGCALPPQPPSPYEAYLKRETAVVPLRPYVDSTKVSVFSDSSKLLDFADKIGGGQGKYETDAAYQQRVSALSLFSVISTISENNIEFDKQTGAIKFSMMLLPSDCPGAKNYSYMAPVCYGLWLPEVRKVMDHYVGQNGYGAKAGVDVIKVKRPMLVLPPVKPPSAVPIARINGSLRITPEQLAKERDDLRLAINLESVPQHLRMTTNYSQATVQNQRELLIDNYIVDIKIAGISVVNIKTHQVYSDKFDISIR